MPQGKQGNFKYHERIGKTFFWWWTEKICPHHFTRGPHSAVVMLCLRTKLATLHILPLLHIDDTPLELLHPVASICKICVHKIYMYVKYESVIFTVLLQGSNWVHLELSMKVTRYPSNTQLWPRAYNSADFEQSYVKICLASDADHDY